MNPSTLESRLQLASQIAAPPRSIADDVLRRLPPLSPPTATRSPWSRPLRLAFLSALSGIAALLMIAFLFTGSNVRLTFAQVQAAVEGQHWMHATFDAGQVKEQWINLQTGQIFAVHFDGVLFSIDQQANTRLTYWNDGVLHQDIPVIYPPGQAPPKWTPRSAWDELVAPYEKAAALPAATPTAKAYKDTLNGSPAIRFDSYRTDGMGQLIVDSQVWADPKTHLPLCIKNRLPLAEREKSHKEWSTGNYDFPATGPADIFALGAPARTPIRDEVATAHGADVQPILDAINQAHDNFLKKYRAILYDDAGRATIPGNLPPSSFLEIVWRDGGKLRDEHHLPALESQNPSKPFPTAPLTPEALLAWAAEHSPFQIQMMNETHTYSWIRQQSNDNPRPQVLVSARNLKERVLFASSTSPETIQWPTYDWGADFQRLPPNPDFPNCPGIRHETGNQRQDYYVDPKNDYLCLLHIDWSKRSGQWVKIREYTLSDLHRVADHAVAGTQKEHYYAAPPEQTSDESRTTTITVTPLADHDYPPATFDPQPLTTGATVEGF